MTSHNISKSKNDIPHIQESLFNSRLFIDFNSTEESDSSDRVEEMSNDNDDKHLLSNELIAEIDSINSNNFTNLSDKINENEKENKNNENSNYLNRNLTGMDFNKFRNYNYLYPSLIFPSSINQMNQININSSFDFLMRGNINNNNYKFSNSKKGKKGEWVCFFCQNLNYGFRTVCNRCKESKSKSDLFYNNSISCY